MREPVNNFYQRKAEVSWTFYNDHCGSTVGQKIDWRERSKKLEAETTSWPSQEMIRANTKGQGVGMKRRDSWESNKKGVSFGLQWPKTTYFSPDHWTVGSGPTAPYARLAVQRNPWSRALLLYLPPGSCLDCHRFACIFSSLLMKTSYTLKNETK